jgi:hypothetical protein
MSNLDELGIKYNCDKSSRNRSVGNAPESSVGHDYLRKYEFYLDRFRERKDLNFLELGIGPDWNMGASAKVWLEYFKREDFKLFIADINPNAKKFQGKRVVINIGNLGDSDFLLDLSKNKYGVILDDASHLWNHQIEGFLALFDSLNDGGVYIIEDIQTSFGKSRESYGIEDCEDAFLFLTKISALCAGSGRSHPILHETLSSKTKQIVTKIDSISFIKHSCIICKRQFY